MQSSNVVFYDEILVRRGLKYQTLQLLSITLRKEFSVTSTIKKIESIVINETEIIFRGECQDFNFAKCCTSFISSVFNEEFLCIFVKSVYESKYIKLYIFGMDHIENVNIFKDYFSENYVANEFPVYNPVYFNQETTQTLHQYIRNYEVEEVNIGKIENIDRENYEQKIFLTDINDTESDNLISSYNIQVIKQIPFDRISSSSSVTDKSPTSPSPSPSPSPSTTATIGLGIKKYIYVMVINLTSILFINTVTKSIEFQLNYYDILELIKESIENVKHITVLLQKKNDVSQCHIYSITLQFATPYQADKTFRILCNQVEEFNRYFYLYEDCPLTSLNLYSQQLSEITDGFRNLNRKKLDKNRLSVYTLLNDVQVQFPTIDIDLFNDVYESVFKVFISLRTITEANQDTHKCNSDIKPDTMKDVPKKMWNNIKNLFVTKPSKKSNEGDKEGVDEAIDSWDYILNKKSQKEGDLKKRSLSAILETNMQSTTKSFRRYNSISLNSSLRSAKANAVRSNRTSCDSNLSWYTLAASRKSKIKFKSLVNAVIFCKILMRKIEENWNNDDLLRIGAFAQDVHPDSQLLPELSDFLQGRMTPKEFSLFLINNEVTDHRALWVALMNKSLELTGSNVGNESILEEMMKNKKINSNLVCKFFRESFYQNKRCNSDILNDVGRTMPNISYFGIKPDGQMALYNVLRAYALLDPEVEYCQGMNFIVAVFLLYMSEEEAFVSLVYYMIILEKRQLYLPTMIGMTHSFYKLERLVMEFCPTLKTHLSDINFPISMYASSWFMTCFTTTYPLHFVVRLFDLLMVNGDNIIYNVSISLISVVADKVQQFQDFSEVYRYFCQFLNMMTNEELESVLIHALNIDISDNLKAYNMEILCQKENVFSTQNVEQICNENVKLKTENKILRVKNHKLQQKVMELQQKIDIWEAKV